ncbi:MAG TPA: hypothetical protein VMG37_20080 [Solirubrobacteraceae bacterium]|nr:hypothetical protein [Solirubrobacteraceae bacterium]
MTARDRIVIVIVLALGAIAAGWFFVVSPKRSQASNLSSQVSSEQSQLTSAENLVAAGMSARRAFAGQYTQLAKLGEAVPPDDDIPSLIVQVQAAAQAAHVSFKGLQLTGGGSSSSSSTSSSSTSSSSSSSANGAAAAAAAAQLPPGAAVGAAGLPTEQFTVTLAGNYFNLSHFFNSLESFVVNVNGTLTIRGRLMTINAINLVPGPNGFPQITATVSATTYIVPPTQGATGGATPAGPAAGTQSQTPTSGSSSTPPAAAVTSVLR